MPNWVKIGDSLSRVTLKFGRRPWKTMGNPPMPHQDLCIISSPYVNSNWSYAPETAKLGFDLCDFDLWTLALAFCMDIACVNGSHSWKCRDDTMMGTKWKRCDRQTYGRTDKRVPRAAWSQIKIHSKILCVKYQPFCLAFILVCSCSKSQCTIATHYLNGMSYKTNSCN